MLQSGGLVELIWKKGINKISHYPCLSGRQASTHYPLPIIHVLILGLGGGSAAKIINQLFPQAQIVGIEIDSLMIKLGKKYFGLDKIRNLKIIKANAIKFILNSRLSLRGTSVTKQSLEIATAPSALRNDKTEFDLILVDLYLGDLIPQQSRSTSFLKKLKKLLNTKGSVIINCLFYGKHKNEAEKVVAEANKVFSKIQLIRAWSNLLVVCQN